VVTASAPLLEDVNFLLTVLWAHVKNISIAVKEIESHVHSATSSS